MFCRARQQGGVGLSEESVWRGLGCQASGGYRGHKKLGVWRTYWVACFVSFSLSAYCQEPPALHVTQWLQAPEGFTGQWSTLRGKVVVLEFWATWCSPCVAAIPHLNQLAREFRNRGVFFLAVTDVDEDRLKPFLAKHPMDAIIGVDTERTNWKSFAVPSIPHTLLIGKDGRLIGATFPDNITAAVLSEALAGKRPALAAKEGIESDLSWDENAIAWEDGVVPDMYAIIKPIKTTTSGAWPRSSHITADGVPLEVLVQIAYQTDSYHIDWQIPKNEQVYRAAFRVPEERKERLLPYMRQTLADLFGLEATWEGTERDVYVLCLLKGHTGPRESRSEEEVLEMRRGKMTLRRQQVAKLCQLLTSSLHAVVVDETGVGGYHDFDLPYQPGQPQVTMEALREIGFEVTKARRNIRVLVVTAEHK